MDEAIKKLAEYREWVLDNEEECHWITEEKIQDCIDCLKNEGNAQDYCEEQL